MLRSPRRKLSLASANGTNPHNPTSSLWRLRMSKQPSKDRASLCLFAFNDGRRCRMLRAADPYLCNYHARREAEEAARQKIGRNISSAFAGNCVSATSLSLALSRTLAATAQGQIKPKQAAIIAYLSQTLMQAIQHAGHEYVQAWGHEAWRQAIRSCFGPPIQPAPPPPPDPPPAQPESGSESAAKSTPATDQAQAPPPSSPALSQPPSAKSPLPPLPKDPATFANQVLSVLK